MEAWVIVETIGMYDDGQENVIAVCSSEEQAAKIQKQYIEKRDAWIKTSEDPFLYSSDPWYYVHGPFEIDKEVIKQ